MRRTPIALVALAWAAAASAELAGRPLSDALHGLASRGVHVLFSSELVRPEMRVVAEPRAKDARRLLEELLAPHGLAAERGAGGRWLVVRRRAPPAEPAPSPSPVPSARLDFQESVLVSDTLEPRPPSPSTVSLSATQVNDMAGALENVYHVLQLLPGVTAPQEFGGRLSVRGGGPDQNLTLLDGVEVHNPYRLFGLTSAFNPETIERFELSTGAFSARHGDRLSSLLVIDSRNGASARGLQGSAALGLTDSNVVFEGRLPGGRRGSWLATARRTYYDLLAERVINGNFPDFADVQLRARWEPRPGQHLTLQALGSRESTHASNQHVNRSPNEDFEIEAGTRTGVVSGTWEAPLGSHARLRSIVSLTESEDRFDLRSRFHLNSRRANVREDGAQRDSVDFERRVGVRDFAARQELFGRAGRHSWNAGLELHSVDSGWRAANRGETSMALTGVLLQFGDDARRFPASVDSSLVSGRLGAWLEDRWQPTQRVLLVPGLRLDAVGVTGEVLLSPRFTGTLTLDAKTRLSLAAGLHSQSPGYEKLQQADDFLELSRGLRSERALQSVLGIERELFAGLRLRVEGYHRRLDRLIVGRLEAEQERAARFAEYDFPASLVQEIPSGPLVTRFAVNAGGGSASGIELLLSRRATPGGRLTGYASYSWCKAERESFGVSLPFAYSRPHAASLVGQLRVSPRLELAASAHAAAGVPFPFARGVRVSSMLDAADQDGDGNRLERIPARDALSGGLVYEPDFGSFGETSFRRMPPISRLDFRASFKPRGASGRWQFYLEVINALGHENAFLAYPELRFAPGAERPTVFHSLGGGFPRMPSFGVRFRF